VVKCVEIVAEHVLSVGRGVVGVGSVAGRVEIVVGVVGSVGRAVGSMG